MRLWGGILPFIGFRELEVTPDMRRRFGLPYDLEYVDCFELAWLNYGIRFLFLSAE